MELQTLVGSSSPCIVEERPNDKVLFLNNDSCLNSERATPGMMRLRLISFCLGFGQGCGLCFYVGAGGYYGRLFSNPRFLIYLCAFFYLPPITMTIAALIFDSHYNVVHGVRAALLFRISVSSLAVVLLLALFSITSGSGFAVHFEILHENGRFVLACGVVLGMFSASFLSASCSMLGTMSPVLVPVIILGQTTAGVYTNTVARVIGFSPGCDDWRTHAYWATAAGTVLFVIFVFTSFHLGGLLEHTYQHHEHLLGSCLSQRDVNLLESSPVCNDRYRRLKTIWFPNICWSMALCQTVAIAMNMSLTPLANQVAQGSYEFTQELVLIKLLADFIGRLLSLFLIPCVQSNGQQRPVVSPKAQAILLWFVEALRLPFWLVIYFRSIHSARMEAWGHALEKTSLTFWIVHGLENRSVLLWMVWLPLISLGAMSSSWCIVIAINMAGETRRATVNLLMTSSIYFGYFVGILIACLS